MDIERCLVFERRICGIREHEGVNVLLGNAMIKMVIDSDATYDVIVKES